MHEQTQARDIRLKRQMPLRHSYLKPHSQSHTCGRRALFGAVRHNPRRQDQRRGKKDRQAVRVWILREQGTLWGGGGGDPGGRAHGLAWLPRDHSQREKRLFYCLRSSILLSSFSSYAVVVEYFVGVQNELAWSFRSPVGRVSCCVRTSATLLSVSVQLVRKFSL